MQTSDLVKVGDLIFKTIDFDQSRERHRTSVNAGMDPPLDELKRRYDGMGSLLTEVVYHVNRMLPEWASQYVKSCVFFPQLDFLMVVECDPETGKGNYDGGGSQDDVWEKIFVADGAVFIKLAT